MKEIPLLGSPHVAFVDDEDFAALSGYRWHYVAGYAVRCPRKGEGGRKIRMHRQILGVSPGVVVDHINGYGLDNQRKNLRVCTQRQNQFNRGKIKTRKATSIYKGVWLAKAKTNPWRAHIRVNGKPTYIGSFATEEDAARAYDQAARKHHGEFARLNFKA